MSDQEHQEQMEEIEEFFVDKIIGKRNTLNNQVIEKIEKTNKAEKKIYVIHVLV